MSSKGYDVHSEPQQQSKIQRFVGVFYNKERGEVLGRTGSSWGKISLFYLIYYGILAAFFAIWLAVFIETLDLFEPRFHGKGSILGDTPGMNYRPKADLNKNLIWFNSGKAFTYKPYVDSMADFLKDYNTKRSPNEAFDCQNEGKPPPGKACVFNWQTNFRDLEQCDAKNDFGYNIGNPCVVVFINKVYGWMPEQYNSNEVPAILSQGGGRWDPNYVGVVCEGLHAADKENLGPVEYAPKAGFPLNFFPYKSAHGYQQPLVMVQFKKPANGRLINVVCKVMAKNVNHNIEEQIGLTRFELMVD